MKRLLVTGLTLLLSACWHIEGSGVLKEESRSVGGFSRVSVSGGLKAEVASGAEASVVVSGDDNVVAVIQTEVSGSTLSVQPEPGVSFDESQPLVVRVTLPALEEIEVSGASRVSARGISARRLSIEASGASHVCAAGWAEELELEASGGSQIHAGDLASHVARADASGASLVVVTADCAIDADASGASEVRVSGSARVDQDASGGSRVVRVE